MEPRPIVFKEWRYEDERAIMNGHSRDITQMVATKHRKKTR
jgi:hypothetical protein